MSMTRWDPWGEMVGLRDAIDRLVSESFIRPLSSGERGSSAASLSLDVRDDGDHFSVSAPVPGVAPEDVEISVLGDTLRIHGERRDQQQKGGEGQRWIMREQRFGAFERVVRLPTAVKADAAQAEFKDGVLTITLPKADEAKERKIPIGRGQGGSQAKDVQIEAGGHQTKQDQGTAGRRSDRSADATTPTADAS